MWIGNEFKGIFHVKFEVIFGLKQMIGDDVMPKFEVICGLEQMINGVVHLMHDEDMT
jgi:hypothetical protein